MPALNAESCFEKSSKSYLCSSKRPSLLFDRSICCDFGQGIRDCSVQEDTFFVCCNNHRNLPTAGTNKTSHWGRRELCILTLSANYTCIASIERHADLAGSWILNCVSVKPNKLVVGLAENGQFAVVEPDSVEKISYPIEGNISCFDCNENMLAVGDVFGHVAAFAITGELCWKNSGQLCALRVHSDEIVVGCSSDGSIRVWNDGILIQKWNGHVNRIGAFCHLATLLLRLAKMRLLDSGRTMTSVSNTNGNSPLLVIFYVAHLTNCRCSLAALMGQSRGFQK